MLVVSCQLPTACVVAGRNWRADLARVTCVSSVLFLLKQHPGLVPSLCCRSTCASRRLPSSAACPAYILWTRAAPTCPARQTCSPTANTLAGQTGDCMASTQQAAAPVRLGDYVSCAMAALLLHTSQADPEPGWEMICARLQQVLTSSDASGHALWTCLSDLAPLCRAALPQSVANTICSQQRWTLQRWAISAGGAGGPGPQLRAPDAAV